ncbi:MAG: hypothetical protein LBB16_02625, partial [Puniceicoccales bacterium]|nr:hypothetical protein [Puniceicoccales bacterium]
MDVSTQQQTLQGQIANLRNKARRTGTPQSVLITINGRECTIEAKTIITKTIFWLFKFKATQITIKHTPLGSRECMTIDFVYNRGRGVDKGLEDAKAKFEQADMVTTDQGLGDEENVAKTSEPTITENVEDVTAKTDKEEKFSQISRNIVLNSNQKICKDKRNSRFQEINTLLCSTRDFIQEYDLSPTERATLRQSLQTLCNASIIECINTQSSAVENLSINAMTAVRMNDVDARKCVIDIALQAEAIEILLDARECGHVGLERNVPPEIKTLGKGNFNTIQLAHTQPKTAPGEMASDPIVLKPCDQSKSENDKNGFAEETKMRKTHIGAVCGNYRRNKATSRLQNMLIEIGEQRRIEVPHVVATVSGAEMSGVPYIAMEMLEGSTVAIATKGSTGIQYNNEFVRRETWIQIQDVLTGQIDRHGDNVMLTANGPVAIDHDLSFPTYPPRALADTVPTEIVCSYESLENLGQYIEAAIDCRSNRNYCMPPVIDRKMFDVIMAIDVDTLANMYQECGLTRLEIQSALSRARGLKEHALAMEKEGRVIDPTEWIRS